MDTARTDEETTKELPVADRGGTKLACPLCGGTAGQVGSDHVRRGLAVAEAKGFSAEPFYYVGGRYPEGPDPDEALALALAHARQALGLHGSPAGRKIDWRLELIDLAVAAREATRAKGER